MKKKAYQAFDGVQTYKNEWMNDFIILSSLIAHKLLINPFKLMCKYN